MTTLAAKTPAAASVQKTEIPARSVRQNPAIENPFRRFFLYFALATVFVRLAVLPEVIAYLTKTDTYLLYLVAPPALIGAVLMGGIRRTLRDKAVLFWLAFFVWMAIATPFSSWQGGSTQRVIDYLRTGMIFLLIPASLAVSWKDTRAICYTIAAAAVAVLAVAKLLMSDINGRIQLQASGTIGNSNDLAAHLLLLLPFLFLFFIGKGRLLPIRIAAFGLILYGLWIILGTASRGALLALGLVLVCLMFRASMVQRLATLIVVVLLGVGAIAILPGQTRARLGELFGEKHQEAEESSESRWYLFEKSVQYTIQHPLFGVGPDQFANYEGQMSLQAGQHGEWHATHCAFTQISAECGIPALIFFVAGLGAAIGAVLRTYRTAVRRGFQEIANVSFCYLIAMVGYLGALTFLANAYNFTLPLFVSLGGAIFFSARREMETAAASGRPA